MDSHQIAFLIAALVIFIIVVAVALWFSKQTMGRRYAHLMWSGYASILFLSVGLSFAMGVGMLGWV